MPKNGQQLHKPESGIRSLLEYMSNKTKAVATKTKYGYFLMCIFLIMGCEL